MVHTKIKALD